jgi:replicative DNA helicase
MQTRKPPSNIKAEMALIGSILYDNTLIDDMLVKPSDMYKMSNNLILEKMIEHNRKYNTVDFITLESELNKDIENVDGYLHDCMTHGVNYSSFSTWESLILDNSKLRKQITIATEMLDNAYSGKDAEYLLKEFDTIETVREDMVMIKDFINETMNDIDDYLDGKSNPGIMTKIRGLDYLVNGLVDGDLIYIGARPSMGKSALAMQMALNIAEQNKSVGIFSLEMQNKKIAKRMLVNQARVHLKLIKEKRVEEPEKVRLINAASKLYNQKISISDNGKQTITDILKKAKRHKKRHGLDIIIIDHFHLLTAEITGSNYEKRSYDSQMLKMIAKELEVPVICLCQLSRALEQRPITARMPILSDLKETGSLEQDGDVIIFIDREDYWHKDEKDYKFTGKARISVAKNRDGETGVFEMNWHGGTQRFENI